MLTKWLREHQRPTWNALAEAVRSPSIGLSNLAEEIHLILQHQPTFSANEKEKLMSKFGMFPFHMHISTYMRVCVPILVKLRTFMLLLLLGLCALVI